MARELNRKIVFENGGEYPGFGFGSSDERVFRVVFNSSIAGYQELISDPSYAGKGIILTYPVIGSYGIAEDDFESKAPSAAALIVREYNDSPSNFRYVKTLSEALSDAGIPAIEGVDTRMMTEYIRENGISKAIITDIGTPVANAVAKIKAYDEPTKLAESVSCSKKWYARTTNPKYNIIAVDCGIKHGVIANLNRRGCNVTIVPFNTSASEIEAMKPDGILVSSGPGAAESLPETVEIIKNLLGKYPLCGIGLGMQLTALAYGAKTSPMKAGHHGGYAVRRLTTGKIEMTSQSHDRAVDAASLPTRVTVTYENVTDKSVEGFECKQDKVICTQHHPESCPGPEDSLYIFDDFVAAVKEVKDNA